MAGPPMKRRLMVIPAVAVGGAAAGASGLAYFAGVGLAYVSLIFGVLFFAFAARYYIATISVLVAPGESVLTSKGSSNGAKDTDDNEPLPMVSIHLALYNEERVVERLLTACSKIDYPNYEVVVVDDSTDGTADILQQWTLKQDEAGRGKFKFIHRKTRQGFKGGALEEAIRITSPESKYTVVFDADFVPPPDILKRFLPYFNRQAVAENGRGNGRYPNGSLAAVQGYQWHTLNRAENWLTRGVSCEFSGNYMVDRTFQEVTGVMKMVAGSVYMIRTDLLRVYGWSGSITEDWELTLRLYRDGYKVLYTPLVQAPAECPSTLGKLVRQRMRWAEGHTYNVKKYFFSVMRSSKVGLRQKLEFLYFAPYYLQSAFLILGTLFWLTSDIVLGAKLPFWTAELGWGLVFTNLLALPVMSLTGLFLEKRARKDFPGILSQLVLIYALAPYQAYAALKGLLEPTEGSWVRTFKSGVVVGFPGRLEPRKVIKSMLPPKKGVPANAQKAITVVFIVGLSAVLVSAFAQGQLSSLQSPPPGYYFYYQLTPQSYSPFANTQPLSSFLMHPVVPSGADSYATIGKNEGTGPVFFSDPAPSNATLPFGASVSVHVWVVAQGSWGYGTQGNLKFRIDIYDPQTNSIRHIQGVGETQVFALEPGLNYYQTSWGHFAQNKEILKGETLVATFWCPDCNSPPELVFNSAAHPSNIDFPIEVPENSLSLAPLAILIPGIAGLAFSTPKVPVGEESGDTGLRRVQRLLILGLALILLTLPLVMTFNDLLTSVFATTGLDRAVSALVPYESGAVSSILRGLGLHAGSTADSVWLGSGAFIPVTALIGWNCSGWQGFVLFGVTAAAGLRQLRTRKQQALVLGIGIAGILAVDVLRILVVVLLGYSVGYPAAIVFHNYGGTLLTMAWLFGFWAFALRRYGGADQ